MLFLMFHIGSDRFVLDAEQVERVLPLMEAKSLPGAPPEVVGVINYRGAPTPLIDLSRVALGRPARGSSWRATPGSGRAMTGWRSARNG